MQDSFVNLTGEIKIVDSQYIFFVKLSVKGEQEISVDKIRFYDQGMFGMSANRISLRRFIRNSSVSIYTDGTHHQAYSKDLGKLIKVSNQEPLEDTLNLGHFYPLEEGKYSVCAEVDYWYGSVKHSSRSGSIDFDVIFIPPKCL